MFQTFSPPTTNTPTSSSTLMWLVFLLLLPCIAYTDASQLRHQQTRQRRAGAPATTATDNVTLNAPPPPLPTTNERVRAFRFNGDTFQYVEFPVWMSKRPVADGPRANLTFEFRTIEPENLFLYFDDGGATNYLKMALTRGRPLFNYKFGDAVASETALPTGRLDDGRWHQVRIERRADMVTFVVDQLRTEAMMPADQRFFIQRSLTYFGGIPRSYSLQKLSLSSVFFSKDLFKGSMRKVTMDGIIQDSTSSSHVEYGKLAEACAPSL